MIIVPVHACCGCFLSAGGLTLPNCCIPISPSGTLRHRVAPCPVGTQTTFASFVEHLRLRPNCTIGFTRFYVRRCNRALANISQGKPVVVVVVWLISTFLLGNPPASSIGCPNVFLSNPLLPLLLVRRYGPAHNFCSVYWRLNFLLFLYPL